MTIQTPDNHFEAVLISAVRYSIGRRTYMPDLVTGWIRGHCAGALSRQTAEVMIRDIDTAASLGDGCDIKTWLEFREWLTKEVSGDADTH